MKALQAVACAFLSLPTVLAIDVRLAARSPPVSSGYGGPFGPPTASSTSDSPTSTGTSSGSSSGLRGDSVCAPSMCISAVVNGSFVQYTLQSQSSNVGWMGMGFGRSMLGTPMVIMWSNPDGLITISQRQASSHDMPTVQANPPRTATLQTTLSTTSGNPKFVYTIPANSDTRQNIIYAFGTTRPSSSDADATLLEHRDKGTLTLDLTKSLDGDSNGGNNSPANGSTTIPLTNYERILMAHGIIATIGFIFLLPIGALFPRYLRTFIPTKWFRVHAVIQFWFAGALVLVSFILGIVGVGDVGTGHFNDKHKRLGLFLFIAYIVQVAGGAFIHWIKIPKNWVVRPPQNYGHALFGILIIALSFYQVRTGYHEEWFRPLPNGVNIVFYVWLGVVAVAYIAGLGFLPKQYAQERKAASQRR